MTSDALFDLATDAIRIYSRATRRFQSIHTTTERASLLVAEAEMSPEQVDSMLARLDPKGANVITLFIDERWATLCRAARDRLEEAAGKPLAMRDILSCLLQELVRHDDQQTA